MFTRTKKSVRDFTLHYGNILGLVSVIFSLMLFFLGLGNDKAYSLNKEQSFILLLLGIVNYGIHIVVLIIALLDFKKTSNGLLSLVDSIKIGMGVFLISALYDSIYSLIQINFLYSEAITKSLEGTGIELDFFSFTVVTGRVMGSLLGGFFSSLILGLIIKNLNPTSIEKLNPHIIKNITLSSAVAMILSIFLPFVKIGMISTSLFDILKIGESPELIGLTILIVAFGILSVLNEHLFARISSVLILSTCLYVAFKLANVQSSLNKFDGQVSYINIFSVLGIGAYVLFFGSILGVIFSKPNSK
tara:strand:- start:739 stop:1647 length:909 start_codon:yes stop_codon:yes gene_type:complete